MNYFVTANGKEVISNISKTKAIKYAKKMYDENKTDVGVGKIKLIKNKKMYTLFPLFFYV